MEKALNNLEKYILYLLVFLLPIFAVPLFPNSFDTPKLALLAVGVGLLIVIYALKTFLSGKFEYVSGNFDIPILIIASSYLLSSIFMTPNKMEAFFVPGITSLIILGTILYFLTNTILSNNKKGVTYAIFLSAIALSLSILFTTVGLFAKFSQIPSFFKDVSFNPLGSPLASAIFLGVVTPLGIGLILKGRGIVRKLFWAVGLTIVLLGLGLSIYPLTPGKATALSLPSYETSWAVTTSSLGESPLLGIGSGNYLSAFNRYRPLSYNSTPLWQARFTSATNFLFTFMTENGLLGLFGLILLILVIVRNLEKNLSENLWGEISLVLALVSMLFLPASLMFLVLLFLLISLNSTIAHSTVSLVARSPVATLVVLPLILVVLVFWFFASLAVLAEARFQNAVISLSQNDGKKGSEELSAAIKTNPYVDRYHALSAQLNLAIARNISQKKNPDDNDKNTITQVIQGAIAEGKATVALNTGRSQNWAFLAGIYQSIMPFAQGADTFAIQTYTQAIALDPIDPNLRINLGGVYYALGRYDDAINAFQIATLAKPDLANTHYNLGIAYREKGEIDKAIAEIKTTLSLVTKGSDDYKLAQSTLDDLEKRKPATTTKSQGTTENLTPPKPAPTPAVNPPIQIQNQ